MDRTIGPETEADLLRVLQAALDNLEPDADEADTITSSELAEHLGMGQQAAAARLKRLLKAGVLEAVMVRRTDAWGRARTLPGYRRAAIRDDS